MLDLSWAAIRHQALCCLAVKNDENTMQTVPFKQCSKPQDTLGLLVNLFRGSRLHDSK